MRIAEICVKHLHSNSGRNFITPFCSGGRGQGQLEFNIRGPDMGLLADYSKKVMEEWGKFPE